MMSPLRHPSGTRNPRAIIISSSHQQARVTVRKASMRSRRKTLKCKMLRITKWKVRAKTRTIRTLKMSRGRSRRILQLQMRTYTSGLHKRQTSTVRVRDQEAAACSLKPAWNESTLRSPRFSWNRRLKTIPGAPWKVLRRLLLGQNRSKSAKKSFKV